MVDPDGVVAVCNRRAFELLDLPADLMALRPRFDAVMPLRLLQEACGAMFAAADGDMSIADGRCPQQTCVLELPNGRIVEVHSGLLAGGRGWLATFEDITAKRHAEEQVVFMARHDALTLLPNRTVFRERIEAAVAQSGREIAAAVLCLDLDHFKVVNDTLGHPVGDLLLRSVGERLSCCVRELDTVARFGGDEFAVLQFGPERAEDVALLAQRVIDVLSNPYEVDGHQVNIGVSIGIAMLPADGSNPDTLLKNADIAMYRAKDDGRGAYRFFEPEMDIRLQQRRRLELELHAALANAEFELFFQPQVNLASGRISGFEALMRWNHPTRGLVVPGEFIHLTEEMGLIVPLGEWALRQACLEAMKWPDDIQVAVNLSPVQFSGHDLVGTVAAALAASGLPARRLDLEVTESVLLANNTQNVQILHQLRDLGVHISMDDFGTGYSSLSYLRSFPFDKIKIDQSFVRDLLDSKDAAAIVRAIAAMGNSLGMATVAEGVEQPEQLERLRAKGCTEVQGYLFSVPLPARDLPNLLHRFHATEFQAA
jgi:diguanylate cyclase (GGDEF)-like protein